MGDVNIKFSKAQIRAMRQSRGFLGPLLGRMLPMVTKVAEPVLKHVVAPLGVQVAASAIDTGIQKGIHTVVHIRKIKVQTMHQL